MKASIIELKKKEFTRLFLGGKLSQKEIAAKLEVSAQSVNRWAKEIPAVQYTRIRINLSNELEKLSKKPSGNEDLIFRYITHLNALDTMIRRAKYLPNI